MEDEISNLRARISDLDAQLIELLATRFGLVSKIGLCKRREGLPVEDPELEVHKRMGRENLAASSGISSVDLESVFSSITKVARQIQRRAAAGPSATPNHARGKKMRVAVMGSRGSFSEEAARDYLARSGIRDAVLIYPISAEGVLASLDSGESDVGIFPIHNSIGGVVIESIFAASEHRFSIEELFDIEVCQCLHALPGVAAKSIDRIMSHPQALAQCKSYLSKNFPRAKLVEANDTAAAAENLQKHPQWSTTAVIAPKRCSELYGLELIAHNIQDQKVNLTKFIAARPPIP